MSESGGCPKALAAAKLGYDPIPRTDDDLLIMNESKMHEGLVISKLDEEGFTVFSSQMELNYEHPLFLLRGHIDGIAHKGGRQWLLEVKALGRSTFLEYQKHGLTAFPHYAAQVRCYSHILNLPILMAVKCRDTGKLLKDEAQPEITFDQIIEKLSMVELAVREERLPEVEACSWRDRQWCGYKFLCQVPAKQDGQEVAEVEAIMAAELWKEGKALEEEAEEKLARAKILLLAFSRQTKITKFQVSGVSVSYLGVRQREYLDEKVLKELVPDYVWKKALKKGKEWEDIRIRALS